MEMSGQFHAPAPAGTRTTDHPAHSPKLYQELSGLPFSSHT